MAERQNRKDQDKVIIRLPDGMREELKAVGKANNRSMNAEIVARLQASTGNAPITAAELADALGCFWNAAIGAAHERQSATAMDAASVMAEGFAAVAVRLTEVGGKK